MAIKKKMQMGGEIGAFSKLKGAAKKKELDNYKKFGDGPGSGPSIDKTKAPAPKATDPKTLFKGTVKKAKSGGSFPDLNKDGKVTKADVLKGRGVIAKKGASVKKCKYGCK